MENHSPQEMLAQLNGFIQPWHAAIPGQSAEASLAWFADHLWSNLVKDSTQYFC